MRGLQKLLGERVIEESEQRIVVAFHVQQPAGFSMQSKLGPGQHLAKFLEGAETAGHRDESIG